MKNKTVKDLMTYPAITVEETTSIQNAIKIMKEKNIGFIPITKNNIITGVITDRDILIRAIGIHDIKNEISNIMTSDEVHFVSLTTPLIDAVTMMATHKIRRLVVLNDGKVVGVLTSKDLLNESHLIPFIIQTYNKNETLNGYEIYSNSNPHDSIKTSDYPL